MINVMTNNICLHIKKFDEILQVCVPKDDEILKDDSIRMDGYDKDNCCQYLPFDTDFVDCNIMCMDFQFQDIGCTDTFGLMHILVLCY